MNYYIYIFLFLYIANTLYILKEDLETKYIPLVGFYPFVVLSTIYYSFMYGYWLGILILYGVFIFILDILEQYKGELPWIGKKWVFLDTGIYDYFLYLFIGALVISEMIQGFGKINFLFVLGLTFLFTFVIGILLLVFHQKKVKRMIFMNHITSYETLYVFLYERKLNEKYMKDETPILLSNEEEKVFYKYTKRVPLFLFGGLFVIFFIFCKMFINQ